MENSDDEKDGVFGNCMPKELSISLTNGTKFVDEVLRGPSDRCLENFRMDKHAFYKLCDILQGKGLLRHTNRIKIEEQLAIFLFIIGHNLRTRAVQELFRYSGETISRHFNNVLNAIMAISLDFFQPPGSDIPPEILEDPRFYPYFKDCVGAVDRIHIPVMVGIDEQGPFPGWEGSASDLRVLNSALTRRNKLQVPEGKYYLVDSKYANMPGFIAPYNGVLCHLNEFVGGTFPHTDVRPPYPLQTQVKLVVAACALHNYIRREKQMIGFLKCMTMIIHCKWRSHCPIGGGTANHASREPGLDIAFDTEQLEFSSQLRDSIAGDMWGDYISDLSTM
uniref:DUF8040 domain-containing protein n=1 Tax=Salix viminalis TaxID=40686 RepID=A0A6N2MQ14_SALVM